jgi:hypothetical protein
MGGNFGTSVKNSTVGRDVSTTGRYLSISGKIGVFSPKV